MRTLLAAAAVAVAVIPSGPADAAPICVGVSRTGALPPLSTGVVCLPPAVYDGQTNCQTTTINTTTLNAVHIYLCLPRTLLDGGG